MSTSTTSALPVLAAVSASNASPAASAPGSRAMMLAPVLSAQIFNWSMAAARKVSPATSITVLPSARNLAASLPMVVVLPEPLTPATRMTKGFAVTSSGLATGASTFSISPASTAFTSSGAIALSKRPSLKAAAMRPAVSGPRSARINSFSRASTAAASSLRFDTRSAMAPPSEDEVRLSPPLKRFHQLPPCVLSFMARP